MIVQIILIAIFLFILSAAIAGLSFAPWVPAWKKDLPRILKLAELLPGQVFYDLGCGNGKVVLYVQQNSQAKAIGLEISLPLYLICKLRQILRPSPNLVFKYKNLFKENLSQADVIYFFGMPDKIALKLKEKLEQELKPGCRVISYTFPIQGWQAVKVDKPNPTDIAIYLYVR